jgi:hypothetical protein
VSEETFERIQRLLELRTRNARHSNIGPSHHLLQGMVRCGLYDGAHLRRVMTPHCGLARRDGTHNHWYLCNLEYKAGGEYCIFVSGQPLETAVREAFLTRLSPPSLDVAKAALRDASGNEVAEKHRLQTRINDLRQRVTDLKYRYLKVDPDNRSVAAEIERELEATIRELKNLERQEQNHRPPANNGDQILDELMAMSADVGAIFDSAEPEERKVMIRMLISAVIIDSFSREIALARIVWSDGEPDTTVEVKLPCYAHRVARQLQAEGLTHQEVADRMNDMGLLTEKGRPWSVSSVAQVKKAKCRRRVHRRGPKSQSNERQV